jgi:hypothetical protein
MTDTRKTVNLTEEQIEWIESKPINFSAWVRAKIEDERKSKVSV